MSVAAVLSDAPAPAGAAPDRPPCVLCGPAATTRRRRRGLCITCYRKLLEVGIALPPAAPSGPPEGTGAWSVEDRVRAWFRAMSPEHRRMLRALIEDVEAADDDACPSVRGRP